MFSYRVVSSHSLRNRRALSRTVAVVAVAAMVLTCTLGMTGRTVGEARWSVAEREALRSLALQSLEPLAGDPSNRVGDDMQASAFGAQLFFDVRLSGNGKVSCATCHAPERDFQDGRPLAQGVGQTARRTMPIAGTARLPFLFWDGRADSQWAQALGPLESAVEHGGNRTRYAHLVAAQYRAPYEALFGALPDLSGLPADAGPVQDANWRRAWQAMSPVHRDQISRVYANIGKAIAAYERRIEATPARFDRYVAAELAGMPHTDASAFTDDEIAGLRVFIGKGNCVNCHNGALFTDGHFHNTGVPVAAGVAGADSGRAGGARQAVDGEFRCTSRYSDAKPEECSELQFAVTEGAELVRAYKTPSLRNVDRRAPFMHAGQLPTLEDVIAHYSAAPRAPFGHSELRPLRLSRQERRQLVAFLRTLTSPTRAPRN